MVDTGPLCCLRGISVWPEWRAATRRISGVMGPPWAPTGPWVPWASYRAMRVPGDRARLRRDRTHGTPRDPIDLGGPHLPEGPRGFGGKQREWSPSVTSSGEQIARSIPTCLAHLATPGTLGPPPTNLRIRRPKGPEGGGRHAETLIGTGAAGPNPIRTRVQRQDFRSTSYVAIACCACAAIGQTAALPSPAMNSRRFIRRSPRRLAAESMGVRQGQAPWRS
jgi:hypothetical protein